MQKREIDNGAQAGVEITEEMVVAGASVLNEYNGELDSPRECVAEIFKKMAAASVVGRLHRPR